MELEYDKKDIKKTPKVKKVVKKVEKKEGVYKQEDVWCFDIGKNQFCFTTKENAEIAYARDVG
jgi:arginyl-tRNA synthetase